MKKTLVSFVGAAAVAISASSAFAAGYEKAVMWSGQWGALGGAATSAVKGAESLYFNPAGLASYREGQEITAQFSPTWSQFEGPFQDNVQVKSKQNFSPIGALIYAYTPSEKWGFGVGGFVSAGTNVRYQNVSISPLFPTQTPDIETDINVTEISVGGGYAITEQWRVGASWRVSFVKANVSTADLSQVGAASVLTSLELKDMEATNFTGFRVGAQYTPNEFWALGLNVRTPISFDADGSATGVAAAPVSGPLTGARTTATVSGVEVSSELPMQVSLGGHYHVTPEVLTVFAEYTWTQYSALDRANIAGTYTFSNAIVGGAGTTTAEVPDIAQDWKDQHNIRVAGEYIAGGWPVRAGYIFTSQVAAESTARPTFSSPGAGHSFTLGTGQGFMENRLVIDGAVEYSMASGDVAATPAAGDPAGGKYSSQAYALHLGAHYWF